MIVVARCAGKADQCVQVVYLSGKTGRSLPIVMVMMMMMMMMVFGVLGHCCSYCWYIPINRRHVVRQFCIRKMRIKLRFI